jgi:hypothetical protein
VEEYSPGEYFPGEYFPREYSLQKNISQKRRPSISQKRQDER